MLSWIKEHFKTRYVYTIIAVAVAYAIVYAVGDAINRGLMLGMQPMLGQIMSTAVSNANVFASALCWLVAKVCGAVVMISVTVVVVVFTGRLVWCD